MTITRREFITSSLAAGAAISTGISPNFAPSSDPLELSLFEYRARYIEPAMAALAKHVGHGAFFVDSQGSAGELEPLKFQWLDTCSRPICCAASSASSSARSGLERRPRQLSASG